MHGQIFPISLSKKLCIYISYKPYHWLFDHGLISIDTDYTIHVSKKINYEYPKKLVSIFQNQQIFLPTEQKNLPSPVTLFWHKNNVFD